MILQYEDSFSMTWDYHGVLLSTKLMESPLACSTVHSVVHVLDGTDDALSSSDEAFIKVHEVEGFGAVNKSFVNGFDHVPGHWRADTQETSFSERCIQTEACSCCVSQLFASLSAGSFSPVSPSRGQTGVPARDSSRSLGSPDLSKWLRFIQEELQSSFHHLCY